MVLRFDRFVNSRRTFFSEFFPTARDLLSAAVISVFTNHDPDGIISKKYEGQKNV